MIASRLFRLALLVAALIVPTFAMADDITFSGEVTYRERIALPRGAQLWVSLVSLFDGRAVAGAAANVAEGASPPLSFVLDVRSGAIRPGASLGITAEIRADGRRLFRTATPVPVSAERPEPISVVVNYAPLAMTTPPPALPADPAPVATAIAETEWSVTSIGGDPVLAGTTVTFSIGTDSRAGGHAGCNQYFAEAQVEDETLAFGPVAGTRMACDADVMAQENRFFAALGGTARYRLEGDTLQFQDAAGVTLVGLVKTR